MDLNGNFLLPMVGANDVVRASQVEGEEGGEGVRDDKEINREIEEGDVEDGEKRRSW